MTNSEFFYCCGGVGGDVLNLLMVFVLCGGRFCVNSGGLFVSGDGNRAMVIVFIPLPDLDFVWVVVGCTCPWWWWWLAWAYIFERIEIFYIEEKIQEIIIQCNFHNTIK